MAFEERLLGFDIRINPGSIPDSFWNDTKRDQYLIRRDIPRPLSVDRLIWPSVFQYANLIGVQPDPKDQGISVNSQVASDGFWFDLEMMRERFAKHASRDTRAVPVAVQLFAASTLTMDQFGSDVLEREVQPPLRPANSVLLGFDVADAGTISALSDCGYSAEDLRRLRPEWSTRINESGLLMTLADAMKFKELSDVRVREHAPFYVYSVYRLAVA